MLDPHLAVIVVTHLWNTDFLHWWHLYFFPVGKPWYEGLVWGNVFAVLPLALLGTITYWIHKWITKDIEEFDAKKAHDEHSKHLRAILDALDPDVAGDTTLDYIAAQVNEETPGGLKTLRDDIKELRGQRPSQP
jgi:hypothetical protein